MAISNAHAYDEYQEAKEPLAAIYEGRRLTTLWPTKDPALGRVRKTTEICSIRISEMVFCFNIFSEHL